MENRLVRAGLHCWNLPDFLGGGLATAAGISSPGFHLGLMMLKIKNNDFYFLFQTVNPSFRGERCPKFLDFSLRNHIPFTFASENILERFSFRIGDFAMINILTAHYVQNVHDSSPKKNFLKGGGPLFPPDGAPST